MSEADEIELDVNGTARRVRSEPERPLLWVLRESLGLNGARYGCGVGQCGACTVHVDGRAVRSCMTPVGTVTGKSITTIEGLARGDTLHPVQSAWIAENVPQCGYCQPGQIMSAVALLTREPQPAEGEIEAAMRGNICRCGTYHRIRRAIRRASRELGRS